MRRSGAWTIGSACLAIGVLAGAAIARLGAAGAETKTPEGVILFAAKEMAAAFA